MTLVPLHLFAQTKLMNPTPGAGYTLKDFILLLIDIIQAVGIPALVVAIVYVGYLLVTAGENEKQITDAKRAIVWTLVGVAIILGATVIANFISGTVEIFET
jgi:hypothetical protein